ncbi:MAG TPA: ATP-binding cassette domain-containing protein [Spirochaetia bacterium]|nr:ATP-binding cassette domain-containing protein [Spirochaetia bacterium]
MAIISVSGLKKSYKSSGKKRGGVVEAVKGIDLTVHEGEIFGFLGPNGAGKSTTLKMLSTLLAPDGGKATIAGFDLLAHPARVRRQIGYVSQAGGADGSATGREDLMLQAQLFGLSSDDAKRRAGDLIQALELESFVDRFSRTYSGGQRRKLDIALGMVHQPALLFLDEPTTGLDPLSRAQLWNQIRLLRRQGTTVFLTTHYMDEADVLCDRIAIIDKGKIVAEDSPIGLKRRISGDILSLKVNHVDNAVEVSQEALRDLDFVREMNADGSSLKLVVTHGGEAIPVVLRLLESRGVGVADISLSRPSLDDVFLRMTGHSLVESGSISTATHAGATSAATSRANQPQAKE